MSVVRPAQWGVRAGLAIVVVAMRARRGAHTVYRLAYHFVWIPRYRRKVLREEVPDWLEGLIREIGAGRAREIDALAVETDHVHLCVSRSPRDAPANGKLWADGYYVGSAGDHGTSDLIEQYIAYQEAEGAGENRLF